MGQATSKRGPITVVLALVVSGACAAGPDETPGDAGGAGTSGGASGAAGASGGAPGVAGATSALGGATGAVPKSGPVPPTLRAGKYVFELGDVSLEIDPAYGGHLTALRFGGADVLTGPDVNAENWGSTFWTSPQTWAWPPPPEIDNKPYAAHATATELVLTGAMSPTIGVSVTKTFSARYDTGAVTITYGLTNGRTTPVRVAPWEVTRVAAHGLTFFPTGPRMTFNGPNGKLATTDVDGVTFFDYDPAPIKADSKLYADAGAGWLAHADAGLILIKKFPDVAAANLAPGEGDVEVYTDHGHTYIELETQGAYGSIAPQASVSWTTTWWLKRLPADVPATAGNAALVKLVRDTVQ
jgi:Domain of unknown function (DUF4380)